MNRVPKQPRTIREVFVGVAWGFLLGVVSTAGFAWWLTHPSAPPSVTASDRSAPASEVAARPGAGEKPLVAPTAPPEKSPVVEAPPLPPADLLSAVADLRNRRLDLPVQGASRGELRDSFNERRDGVRVHEATDMLAARNTPVLAVEDGKVAKLFLSKAGGMTIYQFDPESRYVYYYAHLERYAAGLKEGDKVQRGEIIGYVGTSGNAPKNTPHLHFAIFQLTEKKQWWQGTPLDPYAILK